MCRSWKDLDRSGKPGISNESRASLACAILLVTAVPASSSAGIDTGLVAAYYFDGDAIDASGNGNDGMPTGAFLSTDRFGDANSAFQFDGIDDEILVSDDTTIDFSTALTITAWIYPDEIKSQVILRKGAIIETGTRSTSGHSSLAPGTAR